MPLSPGARIGRYEILSPIGAGGMGEVYRAHDPQLGRDVALKVIGGDEAPSADRLRRFETEARAVAALRHPHILEVHDVGACDGRPYVVLELLEGESLRQRLARGALPIRKAVEIAGQVCGALAAAHARGIVHRDLKPDNLFVASEGVKVLDFGLAKLVGPPNGGSEAPTQAATDPGVWVGTPGYASPEQLRDQAATALSDVFALGAVLYEMLTGRRAFRGPTRADTLTAVLQQDPPPMTIEGGRTVAPALERVVRRCLEKDPEDRFQSARDVAFALEALAGTSTESGDAVRVEPHRRARGWLVALAVVAAVAAAFVAGTVVERGRPEGPAPTFRPLTFRRGWMQQARFAPDGRTVIYAAAWEGQPLSLYETRTDSAESRPLGIKHANVLAVSPQGTMAFVSEPAMSGMVFRGTLAVAPIGGTAAAAAREVLGDVSAAAWTPDGRLFVAVWHSHETTLELPPGNVVFRLPGSAAFARLSPDGRSVAFLSTRTRSLVLLDLLNGSTRTLVERLADEFWGLAWAPSGREVWFTEGRRNFKDVWAVDLSGRRRLVYRPAVDVALLDIAPDGRALLHRSLCRDWVGLFGRGRTGQDVSVGHGSTLLALSADGRDVLLGDSGRTFLRRFGGEPLPVAEGQGQDLSPDGGAVLVVRDGRLDWVPTGVGVPRTIDTGISRPTGARFVPPDGKRVLVWGVEPDGQLAPYRVVPVESTPTELASRTLAPPVRRVTSLALSPDGRLVAGVWNEGTLTMLPLDGSPARDVGSVPPYFTVSRWSDDGKTIFLANPQQDLGCTLARFDFRTSRFEPLRNVAAADATGVNNCNALISSGDGTSCAAEYSRCLTDLVLAEGLR